MSALKLPALRLFFSLLLFLFSVAGPAVAQTSVHSAGSRPILTATIDGSINPATFDFLKSSLAEARKENAKLLVIKLNTPGGLLTSMQSMVELLLESEVPVAVYVSPRGGGAISAGVFITMAGHLAVMAPGTTIGAAHPVTGSGDDIKGDMREKIENFAVSHIKAIAEQRGRNVKWAEEAVRESVAITAKEAVEEKVVDFIAGDLEKLLAHAEGRSINVRGKTIGLNGLQSAPVKEVEMTLRQQLVNVLSDPNIAILLGLGAIVGIGLELLNPGSIFPGIFGGICLILSLTAAQVIPINYGGVALFLLGAALLAVEMFTSAFGLLGGAGVVCMVLGAIYLVDTGVVWGVDSFAVDYWFVGSMAAVCGAFLFFYGMMAIKVTRAPVVTGRKGMIGEKVSVLGDFEFDAERGMSFGKVSARGEIWNAQIEGNYSKLGKGDRLEIKEIEGLTITLEDNGD